jgi:hypothetical protein
MVKAFGINGLQRYRIWSVDHEAFGQDYREGAKFYKFVL